jgi:AP-1-like transcription factor
MLMYPLTTLQRRREQNRTSQRAYRERKERYQRELEQQIEEWQRKHQLLSQSYSKQDKEVSRLKSHIKQLNGEITTLKNGLPSLCESLNKSATEFDLVPFHDTGRLSQSSPKPHHSFS